MGTLNKIILKTALYSFAGAFIFFSYVLVIIGHAFPATMAGWAESLGAAGASAMYRERVYNHNKTAENYYYMLDKFVVLGDAAKIIKYAPGFFEMDAVYGAGTYDGIIDSVNDFKYKQVINYFNYEETDNYGNAIIAAVCNEDDRLRCALIKAYLKKGQLEMATSVFGYATSVAKLDRPSNTYFALGNENKLDSFEIYFLSYLDLYNSFNWELIPQNPLERDRQQRIKIVADDYLKRMKIFLGIDDGEEG